MSPRTGAIVGLMAAITLLTVRSADAGPILYVDDSATGANDGASWCDGFVYLQDALAAAEASGGVVTEVRVAQGSYKPDQGANVTLGDRTASFDLVDGVAIRGGYAGCGAADQDARDIDLYKTRLNGDLNDNDGVDFQNYDENSFHVVTGSGVTGTAVLEGFTITAGSALQAPTDDGAGLLNVSGDPTITNCTFIHNDALGRFGGAIANVNGSPSITSCVFQTNRASFGGAIANMDGSNPIVNNCTFLANTAPSAGGGIINYQSSNPTILACTFVGNAGGWGGGMSNLSNSNPTVANCVFSGNTGPRGGGIYTDSNNLTTITNCTFAGNTSWETGAGGIHNVGTGIVVTNCVFWDNLWGKPGDIATAQIDGISHVSYSCVQDNDPDDTNVFPGTGNTDASPHFVDATGPDGTIGTPDDNLRVSAGSSGINAGVNSAVTTTTDRDGNPRIVNGTVDMGAYEYQGECLSNPDCDNNDICDGIETCINDLCELGTPLA